MPKVDTEKIIIIITLLLVLTLYYPCVQVDELVQVVVYHIATKLNPNTNTMQREEKEESKANGNGNGSYLNTYTKPIEPLTKPKSAMHSSSRYGKSQTQLIKQQQQH